MDWLSENAWAAWLGLAGALTVAEMFSLDLIFIMLAVGAMAGMVAGLASAPLVLQVLVAAAASLATLALLRPPLLRRLHNGPTLKQGTDKLIGTQAVSTTELSAAEPGRVRLGGEIWTAAPYDPTLVIGPDQTVEVLEIRGATAYVHPVELP